MTTTETHYVIASHESIYGALQRGMWHNMPYNHTLNPIDSSTVMLVKADGTETNATDAKIDRYVRLIQDPKRHLERWDGNPSTAFLIQIDPRLFKAKDILKIKRIADDSLEMLKSMMVDASLFARVHVASREVEQKLRAAMPRDKKSTPIVVTPSLFPDRGHSTDFEILRPDPELTPSPPTPTQLKIVKGDLLKSPMQTHVNTVNCVGVMGKGIAKSFKNQYPDMFADYAAKCKEKRIKPGVPYVYRQSPWRLIVNFPTKDNWRQNSKWEYVEEGLKALVHNHKNWGIQSLAIPPLGCGNGGLEWEEILPLMRHYLSQMNIPIEIYAPHDAGVFGEPLSGKKRKFGET